MLFLKCSVLATQEHIHVYEHNNLTETTEELKKHFGDPVAIMQRAKQNISKEKIESFSE